MIAQLCGCTGYCPSLLRPGLAGRPRRRAGLCGCGYGWGQLSELYLDLESVTTKELKPQLEPIVRHRHSTPCEDLKRIHCHSEYANTCPGSLNFGCSWRVFVVVFPSVVFCSSVFPLNLYILMCCPYFTLIIMCCTCCINYWLAAALYDFKKSACQLHSIN